jgi:hypothetical protein
MIFRRNAEWQGILTIIATVAFQSRETIIRFADFRGSQSRLLVDLTQLFRFIGFLLGKSTVQVDAVAMTPLRNHFLLPAHNTHRPAVWTHSNAP